MPLPLQWLERHKEDAFFSLLRDEGHSWGTRTHVRTLNGTVTTEKRASPMEPESERR